MGARIIPFFEKVTETFSYLVIDPLTHAALIIDPVLDYDPAAGRIMTHSADAIANAIQAEELRVEWILETHVHADHLSAAGYLKKKLAARSALVRMSRNNLEKKLDVPQDKQRRPGEGSKVAGGRWNIPSQEPHHWWPRGLSKLWADHDGLTS